MNGILLCIFELVVGVLLLIDPIGFTTGIIIAAGIVLVVVGLISCVKYFRADIKTAVKGQLLTKGLLALLFGTFCILNSEWFLATFSVLTALYGVAVLLSGIEKIQLCIDALRQKRDKWYFAAISAAVSMVCAVIILRNPFTSTAALWIFIGVSLVVEAVFDVATLILNKGSYCNETNMEEKMETIRLNQNELTPIRNVDERLVSYNIEMTEVTGGTFWKAYTPGQIAGTEEFKVSGTLSDFTAMAELMQYYPPIDLYNERLRTLTKKLGPTWIRVSGTWATKTYYDFDGTTGGQAPEGYASVLTREQWIGVLDFVKAMEGRLLISVSNCAGDHPNNGPLDLTQARKIFALSHEYGVDIDAVEFMNEPNMLEISGAPAGYTAADFARDQDIFNDWVRENYPDCLIVGPCSLGDGAMGKLDMKKAGAGIGALMEICTTDDLMNGSKVPLDVFSYHYYNGCSERLASMMPDGHWSGDEAHTDEYLSVAPFNAKTYASFRNKYVPGGQMWVTESGDAGGGGNTWASTYLDVLRTLNELGSFATITDGVIFHNTLASSDYGFLEHGSFKARPNYFAVLLWNRLMGTTVYDCNNPGVEGAHIYCHSRKDQKPGVAYLIINNSLTDITTVELPKSADRYTLSAVNPRASVMQLNGCDLTISGVAELPELTPIRENAGMLELAPCSCTFLVM